LLCARGGSAITGSTLWTTPQVPEANLKLVVLNACYSEVHAEALLAHVDCVVGMSDSLGDA
jgi:hypothetical protein